MSRSPQGSDSARSPTDYVAGWQATLRLLRQGKSWSGYERNCAFLNIGGLRFADVSAASGLDFPDDGRGVAMVDWDADGDLDLWLANRTAPRLRLMLNRSETTNAFVALRLRGTTSNRDAIGARVEVELERGSDRRLVQTVYAGDGFLSQSSKWLHFGLGPKGVIKRVTVHWPGGKGETFTGVRPGNRYLIVEGAGEATAATTRSPRLPTALAFAPQESPAPQATESVLLPVRVPLPRLSYAPLEGATRHTVEATGRPLLINFWASWCVPCVGELEELTDRAEELEASGLDILALSVDGLDRDQMTQPADAIDFLGDLGFAFASGFATADLLEKIELLQEALFDRILPFAVPMSLLLDGEGALAATYRGRLDLDRLMLDLGRLEESWERLQKASAPLPGRWIAQLPDPNPGWLATRFGDRFPEDAERYLDLALDQLAAKSSKPLTSDQRTQLDHEEARLRLRLAGAVSKQNRPEEAMAQLRQAIALNEDLARAHATLAGMLRPNDPELAIRHYRRAVAIDPEDAAAHHGLGLALRSTGRLEEAFQHLGRARSLRPDWPAPLIPMAWILIGQAELDGHRAGEAVRLAEKAVALSEESHPVALDTLAAAYAAAGRTAEAATTAREAVERAKTLGDEALAASIEGRLLRYRQKSPAPDSG